MPFSIETQLSNLSSNETLFHHAIEDYENVLKKSGYNVNQKSNQNTNQNTRNKRNYKRNIIWFNPPFSKTVSTKMVIPFLIF